MLFLVTTVRWQYRTRSRCVISVSRATAVANLGGQLVPINADSGTYQTPLPFQAQCKYAHFERNSILFPALQLHGEVCLELPLSSKSFEL